MACFKTVLALALLSVAAAAKVPLCEEPKVTVRHAYTTVDAALYDQTNVGVQFTVICNSKAVKAPLFFKDGDSYSPVGRQTRGTMYQVSNVYDHAALKPGAHKLDIYTQAGIAEESPKPYFEVKFNHEGASMNPLPCASETLAFWVLALTTYVALNM